LWFRRDSEKKNRKLARIRFGAVNGLQHCSSERALRLLRDATEDPHPEVAERARGVLAEKEADT